MQPNQSNGIEGASMGAPLALVKADVKLAAYALGRLVRRAELDRFFVSVRFCGKRPFSAKTSSFWS